MNSRILSVASLSVSIAGAAAAAIDQASTKSLQSVRAKIDAETMFGVYDGYHTLSPDEAVARLKEASH